MGLDDPWQRVVSAALIGTERQPFTRPTATGKLGQVLAQLSDQSTEATLLTTAAILSLHQRAGWLPETYPASTLQPSNSDDLPRCNPRAAQLLQQMLQGQYTPVLPEWLAIAAKAGQRVSELHLPELLDLGKQQRNLRAAILPVLGQRGRWLAAQNPDWSYAVKVATEDDWETGSAAARLLYLQDLRVHQPDRARELLQATWNQEPASDRAKFLETFRTGLSMADEPFLEAALDDRSKEVRRVAADLLASLSNSRLCQRMAERLTSLVKFKKAVGRPYAFNISLPETCNADMQRDGIELKPRSPMGERAWWLQQMISATPLTFWEHLESMGTIELIKLAQVNEWKDTLIQGWRSAIQRQQNEQWAEAFLQHADKLSQEDLQLLTVLTWEQCQSLACRLYQTSSHLVHSPGKDVALVLAQNRIPWNDDLARYVLQDILRYWANNGSAWNWLMRELLKASALCIQFSFFSEATALLSTGDDPALAELVQPFRDTLQFRQEMVQAFEMRNGG